MMTPVLGLCTICSKADILLCFGCRKRQKKEEKPPVADHVVKFHIYNIFHYRKSLILFPFMPPSWYSIDIENKKDRGLSYIPSFYFYHAIYIIILYIDAWEGIL